jgi:hypothetical protein
MTPTKAEVVKETTTENVATKDMVVMTTITEIEEEDVTEVEKEDGVMLGVTVKANVIGKAAQVQNKTIRISQI